METVTKGLDARLADRPFLVFDCRALWRSTKNGRLASLASSRGINVAVMGTLR